MGKRFFRWFTLSLWLLIGMQFIESAIEANPGDMRTLFLALASGSFAVALLFYEESKEEPDVSPNH